MAGGMYDRKVGVWWEACVVGAHVVWGICDVGHVWQGHS